jgi:dienelactone hydrolase
VKLSPSENHRCLLSRIAPKLGYDGGEVKTWQRRLRRQLRTSLGRMPEERVPLRPKTLWKREVPLGIIEKTAFTSEPGADVVGYVCLPHGVKPPYTFMICLQGHTTGMHNSIAVERDDNAQPLPVEGDRDFGLGCMRRGMAALCLEQRSFGERRERKQAKVAPQSCHDATMHALMLGRTMIGERVFDVDRGIDYLEARGDADMNLVGVMGNSGGGTISIFSAALCPRIAAAMPSSCFCTFRDSILAIPHCECNYVPGLINYAEMSDIAGLIAPKPVVMVNGREDAIFPIGATRRAFRSLRRIYQACGAADRCHLVVGNGGHRFYADDAWPVMLEQMRKIRQKTRAQNPAGSRKTHARAAR